MEEDVGSRHVPAFAPSAILFAPKHNITHQCPGHQRFSYVATAVGIKYSRSLETPNLDIYIYIFKFSL